MGLKYVTDLRQYSRRPAYPRRSREVAHFCSDRVDHKENTSSHVARAPSKRFIIHAVGVQVIEQVWRQHYHPRGEAARHK